MSHTLFFLDIEYLLLHLFRPPSINFLGNSGDKCVFDNKIKKWNKAVFMGYVWIFFVLYVFNISGESCVKICKDYVKVM